MIKTIQLLQEKNNLLEKFVSLNRNKIQKLLVKDFSGLEEFREEREAMLNIVKHIDEMIDERMKDVNTISIPSEVKRKVQNFLELKDGHLHSILDQDLQIMQIIDEAKSQIILDLQTVRRNKKTIGSFKSYNPESNLDEEA